MSAAVIHDDDIGPAREVVRRWMLAALFVTAVHGGVALAVAHWPRPQSPAGEPPAAVLIELAPEIAAPEVPPEEVAIGEQQEASEESTPTESDEPVEEELPEPEPLAAAAPTETLAEEIPELPEIKTAEAVINVPMQELEPEPDEEKPPEEPEKTVEQKKTKPKPRKQSAAQAASAPRPVDAARARTNRAPSSGMGSSMSMATWRGTIIAHLNRRKRSAGGSRGTATVAFSINRSGQVLSARLVRSSGNAALDREAVALVRRASPVPAPPANVKGNSVLLSVPVRIGR